MLTETARELGLAAPRVRDYQRTRVYRAERELGAFGEIYSLAQCREIVSTIAPRVTVEDGRGHRRAVTYRGPERVMGRGENLRIVRLSHPVIALPRWARNDLLILHELSHVLTPREYSSHGRTFATVFLRLLAARDWSAYQRLRQSFDAQRVSYWPAMLNRLREAT